MSLIGPVSGLILMYVSDFFFFFLKLLFCINGSIWVGERGSSTVVFADWPHSVVICNTTADGKH